MAKRYRERAIEPEPEVNEPEVNDPETVSLVCVRRVALGNGTREIGDVIGIGDKKESGDYTSADFVADNGATESEIKSALMNPEFFEIR